MSQQQDFYTVKKGDTLWKIARDHGTTASELQKINGIKRASQIQAGQRIALRREAMCGVEALFLDRDRNPIKGIKYRLEACGKHYTGATGENGKARTVITETPEDLMSIWVQRLDGTWKKITTVVSGYGNKLVTLVSAHMVIETRTEKHPELRPGEPVNPKARAKPSHSSTERPIPTISKKKLGLTAEPAATKDGEPLVKVMGDIPDLSFLHSAPDLTGITEVDYIEAGKALNVSPAHIKTVTEVEAKGQFFWICKQAQRPVPPILFERHKFSRHSAHKYDEKYPDISSKRAGGYIGHMAEYKRLVKAIQLDREAALKAASWGAFQIMGEHHAALGFPTAEEFVKFVSHSAKNQLQIFVKSCEYVKNGEKLYAQRTGQPLQDRITARTIRRTIMTKSSRQHMNI